MCKKCLGGRQGEEAGAVETGLRPWAVLTCARREAKEEVERTSPYSAVRRKSWRGLRVPKQKMTCWRSSPSRQSSSSTPTALGHWLEQPGRISEGAAAGDSRASALPTGGSLEGESEWHNSMPPTTILPHLLYFIFKYIYIIKKIQQTSSPNPI